MITMSPFWHVFKKMTPAYHWLLDNIQIWGIKNNIKKDIWLLILISVKNFILSQYLIIFHMIYKEQLQKLNYLDCLETMKKKILSVIITAPVLYSKDIPFGCINQPEMKIQYWLSSTVLSRVLSGDHGRGKELNVHDCPFEAITAFWFQYLEYSYNCESKILQVHSDKDVAISSCLWLLLFSKNVTL